MSQFLVIDKVEQNGKLYPLIPPLECEVSKNDGKWAVACDAIRVEGCDTMLGAFDIFEDMLRECIIDGKVGMDMGDDYPAHLLN